MPDARFYEALGPVALGELASIAQAELARGDPSVRIASVAPLDHAKAGDIGFLSDVRYASDLRSTRAGGVILAAKDAELAPLGCAILLTSEPLVAYARMGLRLHRVRVDDSRSESIHPEAQIEADVRIARGAVVGAGARIGKRTSLEANCTIGPGVTIGRDGHIGANVTIGFALIGDRVRILAGAVIGEAGFGVAMSRRGAVDVPQFGRVIIQDDVTVGANTCIDRGAWHDTIIGDGTKIDNLVQVAHNVRIGRNCILAAHTGVSGSVVVGDGAMFGGRAGIIDHLRIGSGAKIGAGSVVLKNMPAGATWAGTPARPLRRWLRETAWLARQSSTRDASEA